MAGPKITDFKSFKVVPGYEFFMAAKDGRIIHTESLRLRKHQTQSSGVTPYIGFADPKNIKKRATVTVARLIALA